MAVVGSGKTASQLAVEAPLAALTGDEVFTATKPGQGTRGGQVTLLRDFANKFLQLGTGAVSRVNEDKLRETITVTDFGAKTDASVNATPAITAAYQAAIAQGGRRLFFPKGRYKISSSIPFTDVAPMEICGEGMDRTIIEPDVGCLVPFNCQLPLGSGAVYNFGIRDLTLRQNTAWGPGSGASALMLAYRGGVEIERVRFGIAGLGDVGYDYGIRPEVSCPSLRVKNCHFNYCQGYGIFQSDANDFSGHNAFIMNNSFVGCGTGLGGVAIRLSSGLDMSLFGNDFAYNRIAMEFENSIGVTIFGNQIESNAVQAFRFLPTCTGFNIFGNLIGSHVNPSSWANMQHSSVYYNDFYDSNAITLDYEVDVGYNDFYTVPGHSTSRLLESLWRAPTFQNSFVNTGTGYANVGYRLKGMTGQLELRGAMTGTTGQVAFTLPVAYRPSAVRMVACPNGGGNGIGILYIGSNGQVIPLYNPGSSSMLLDGVCITIL